MSKDIDVEYSFLINKSQFKKWNLPKGYYNHIDVDNYPFFFIICNTGIIDVGKSKLTIIPTKYNNVSQLRIVTKIMSPVVLQSILKKLKTQEFQILSTSGACTQMAVCEFNVYFSTSYCGDFEGLINDLKLIENVTDATIIVHAEEGCDN